VILNLNRRWHVKLKTVSIKLFFRILNGLLVETIIFEHQRKTTWETRVEGKQVISKKREGIVL